MEGTPSQPTPGASSGSSAQQSPGDIGSRLQKLGRLGTDTKVASRASKWAGNAGRAASGWASSWWSQDGVLSKASSGSPVKTTPEARLATLHRDMEKMAEGLQDGSTLIDEAWLVKFTETHQLYMEACSVQGVDFNMMGTENTEDFFQSVLLHPKVQDVLEKLGPPSPASSNPASPALQPATPNLKPDISGCGASDGLHLAPVDVGEAVATESAAFAVTLEEASSNLEKVGDSVDAEDKDAAETHIIETSCVDSAIAVDSEPEVALPAETVTSVVDMEDTWQADHAAHRVAKEPTSGFEADTAVDVAPVITAAPEPAAAESSRDFEAGTVVYVARLSSADPGPAATEPIRDVETNSMAPLPQAGAEPAAAASIGHLDADAAVHRTPVPAAPEPTTESTQDVEGQAANHSTRDVETDSALQMAPVACAAAELAATEAIIRDMDAGSTVPVAPLPLAPEEAAATAAAQVMGEGADNLADAVPASVELAGPATQEADSAESVGRSAAGEELQSNRPVPAPAGEGDQELAAKLKARRERLAQGGALSPRSQRAAAGPSEEGGNMLSSSKLTMQQKMAARRLVAEENEEF